MVYQTERSADFYSAYGSPGSGWRHLNAKWRSPRYYLYIYYIFIYLYVIHTYTYITYKIYTYIYIYKVKKTEKQKKTPLNYHALLATFSHKWNNRISHNLRMTRIDKPRRFLTKRSFFFFLFLFPFYVSIIMPLSICVEE